MSFFESPGVLERISTAVIVTFSMEWLYLMTWSYKKFLYLRRELLRILNEWLRKRPFRLCYVSPTYWAPQPLASHVITYIKFELFQSMSLSIWMPYLLPLIEDVIVDLHEIWWHVKHLLELHVTTNKPWSIWYMHCHTYVDFIHMLWLYKSWTAKS